MMKFKNVKVPEGINVSRHSPLADLAMLLAGMIVIFGVLVVVVVLAGGTLARHMPVSWENALAKAIFEPAVLGDLAAEETASADAAVAAAVIEAELQSLADRLSEHMTLPEGLKVTVHYLEDDGVNAFASFGGQVFILKGLLQRMPHENALAMVMAHEIAHVANRDAMAAAGGGLLLQLLFAAVGGAAPDSVEKLLAGENALLLMAFGREAEQRADREALAAVAALYGHVAGSGKLFEVFLDEAEAAGVKEPPEFLSTHPLSRDRIEELNALAREQGWPREGGTTSLPRVFVWLTSDAPESAEP